MNELSPPNLSELKRAEAVSPDPVNPKIRTLEVIDTDFHFSPKWETLRNYLKEPFKSRLFHFPVGSLEYNPEPANEKPGVGRIPTARRRLAPMSCASSISSAPMSSC
jgi:hypothetical protein